MTNVTQNLILAEYAVKYVEQIMSRGPGPFNRSESIVKRVAKDEAKIGNPFPREGSDVSHISDWFLGAPSEATKKERLKERRKDWATSVTSKIDSKGQEIKAARMEQ